MELTARPTQQKRAAETQRKIVAATVECLVESGVAALTTTMVGKRAGTSQGSIFKHFPSKAALIAAAVSQMYDDLLDSYRQAVTEIDPGADLIDACVDALWDLFQTPQLLAVFELHIAARTDPVLREIMAPREKAHRANIRQLARVLFPEARHSPHFIGGIEILINSVQGAAVGSMALREEAIIDQLIASLKMVAHQILEVSTKEGQAP